MLAAVMELVGERYRPGLGTAIQVAFSLGYMLQPVLAYKLRDEFWYQVAATSPNLVFPFIVMYVHMHFLAVALIVVTAHVVCLSLYVCYRKGIILSLAVPFERFLVFLSEY